MSQLAFIMLLYPFFGVTEVVVTLNLLLNVEKMAKEMVLDSKTLENVSLMNGTEGNNRAGDAVPILRREL